MAKIERGAWSQLLRRVLSMKGTSDVAAELAPEISGAFILEDPASAPDWHYLKGWKLMSSSGFKAADAASVGTMRFRNPAASATVAVVYQVTCSFGGGTGSGTIRFGRVLVDLANVFAPVGRDLRHAPVAVGSAIVCSHESISPLLPIIARPNSQSPTLAQPIILSPGTAIDVETGAINLSLAASLHWLEKPLPALER